MTYPVTSVIIYDCLNNNCEDGQCASPTCQSESRSVSANGRIYVETVSEPDANGHVMKRFLIRGDDGTTNMVFTSKSFNVKFERGRHDAYAMLCIEVRYFTFKIFIKFENLITARVFYYYVRSNGDLNVDIPLHVPYAWKPYV